MSNETHTTKLTLEVKHRFAKGDVIRSKERPNSRLKVVGVTLPDEGASPIYLFDRLAKNRNDTISYFDHYYELVPPPKKVRVYTITVEVPEDEGLIPVGTRAMLDAVNRTVRHAWTLPYEAVRCESTVEEREA